MIPVGCIADRKGVTQNVLGVCNFDMHFIIALAGWEGSAHDARVLHDAAVVRRILPLYDGWYYRRTTAAS